MNPYLALALMLWSFMTGAFLFSIVFKRNDVADTAWGSGFILLAWAAFLLAGRPVHALLVNLLVTLWGSRLSFHILSRIVRGPEDFRYRNWRSEWKRVYLRSYFQVFMLQGTLLFIVALPVMMINFAGDRGEEVLTIGGLFIWLTGFLIEAIADLQLSRFKRDPSNKGKILTTGLWRYSRHPNYFGDAVQWWGIFIICLGYPQGWMTIISPLVMTYLLRFVSGVPMLEERYRDDPAYQAYARRTPVFVPRVLSEWE